MKMTEEEYFSDEIDEELFESDATSEELICTDSDSSASETGKLIMYISFLFLLIKYTTIGRSK